MLETIAAVHAGMQVLGVSIITNMCMPEAPMPSNAAEIIDVARSTAPQVDTLIQYVLEHLDEVSTLDTFWA